MSSDKILDLALPEKGISYKNLLERRSVQEITYGILLRTEEWLERRQEIISRDCEVCQDCGKEETSFPNISGLGLVVEPEEGDKYSDEVSEKRLRDELLGAHWPIRLQVHHKYYVDGWLPWEYPNDALVSLCQWCHQERHESEDVPTFKDEEGGVVEANLVICPRCNGSGYLPQYSHVEDGICFRCRGARYLS